MIYAVMTLSASDPGFRDRLAVAIGAPFGLVFLLLLTRARAQALLLAVSVASVGLVATSIVGVLGLIFPGGGNFVISVLVAAFAQFSLLVIAGRASEDIPLRYRSERRWQLAFAVPCAYLMLLMYWLSILAERVGRPVAET